MRAATWPRLPHHRISDGSRYRGPFECVGEPWQLEPDREALVEALRWVRDHPEERAEASREGPQRAGAGAQPLRREGSRRQRESKAYTRNEEHKDRWRSPVLRA